MTPRRSWRRLGDAPGWPRKVKLSSLSHAPSKAGACPLFRARAAMGRLPKDQLDSVLGALDQRAKELGVAAISQEEMARGLPIRQPTASPTAPPTARPPAGFIAAVAGNTKVAKSVEAKKALSPPPAYPRA